MLPPKSNNIFILTGKIKTGKSSVLYTNIAKKKNFEGIIQLVQNDKRFLIDILTREKRELTARENNVENIEIGPYLFRNETFEWAKRILEKTIITEPSWIVIDEFGKLELNNSGLEPTVKKLVENFRNSTFTKIMIVVRNGLVNEVLNYLSLKKTDVEIIEKEVIHEILS